MVAAGGSQNIGTFRNASRRLSLAGGKAPSTLCTKDTVQNLAAAEDNMSEVESRSFQRLAGKMLRHSMGGPTIQLEMAMVVSGMWKPTVGAIARLMQVIHHCIGRPRLSWKFKIDPADVGSACGCGPRV